MIRYTREQLRRRLQEVAGVPVHLTLTTNTSSYVSFQGDQVPRRVRLQRAFLMAPEAVVTDLGRWIGGQLGTCPKRVRQFINFPPPEAAALSVSRRRRLKWRGRHHDLKPILERILERFFEGRIAPRITWGRRAAQRAVRMRTLGSYYRNENLVVIHPVLDQAEVPEWFVEFTVYHECLHAAQRVGEQPHGRAFNARLRRHPDYVASMKWERANIRLLTSGRNAVPRKAAWKVERKGKKPGGSRQLGFPW
jgi:hypothetical protein